MRIRTIPRLFLILAGISLLAVRIFPHHHHGGELCFVPSHVHTNQSGCDGLNDHSHHDDDANHCVLNFLTVTLTPGSKYSTKVISREVLSGNDQLVQPEFLFSGGSWLKPDFHREWLAIRICSLTHKCYLYNPLNLRAPPLVKIS